MADPVGELIATSKTRRALRSPHDRRRIRRSARISQAELAAVLGVARPTISRWESGERTPSRRLIAHYNDVLDRLANDLSPARGSGRADAG